MEATAAAAASALLVVVVYFETGFAKLCFLRGFFEKKLDLGGEISWTQLSISRHSRAIKRGGGGGRRSKIKP